MIRQHEFCTSPNIKIYPGFDKLPYYFPNTSWQDLDHFYENVTLLLDEIFTWPSIFSHLLYNNFSTQKNRDKMQCHVWKLKSLQWCWYLDRLLYKREKNEFRDFSECMREKQCHICHRFKMHIIIESKFCLCRCAYTLDYSR